MLDENPRRGGGRLKGREVVDELMDGWVGQ